MYCNATGEVSSCASGLLMFAAAQGFLYVLDCKGQSREGWPIQMGEIQVAF